MIYRSMLLLLALLAVGSVSAQNETTPPDGAVLQRSIRASQSAEAFRPIGEYRIWRFFGRQTTFGQLSSAVKGKTEIDGRSALIVEEALQIDFTKIGAERQVITKGETYVSDAGRYLGSRMEMGDGTTSERLDLTLSGDELQGFFTRAGTERPASVPYANERFFWDANLVDQLEYFLAMRDLEVGTRFDDSIFLPQSLMSARIVGQVDEFVYKEIYKNKFDSVFVIRLTEPSVYQLYFTPDKRLVRVDFVYQQYRVYQDLVRQTPVPAQTKPTLSVRTLLLKLPHYVAFLIVAGLLVLMFATSAFRWSVAYLFLAGGVLVYPVVPLAVNPLLVQIVTHWLRPMMTGGGSLYLAGAVPPLVLSLVQVALIVAVFVGLRRWLQPRRYRLVGLGAFLGAGFALAEAMYVSGLQIGLLFDWPLTERASQIAVHIVSGGLLGWSMATGAGRIRRILIVIFAAGAVARYLPLLVQGDLVGVEAMHFVLVLGALLYLFLALVTVKREPKSKSVGDGATPEADKG